MRIYKQRNGKVNEGDGLQLAALLIKYGYTVKIGKTKQAGKSISQTFIEFIGDSESGDSL